MTGAAVAALVVLAGRLPGHAEPGGNLWPANAQSDGVIDQHGKLCLCLPLRDPGALISSSTWGGVTPGVRLRWSRHLCRSVALRPAYYLLGSRRRPAPRLAHATQHPAQV